MSIDLLFFLKKENHDKDFIFQKKRMKSSYLKRLKYNLVDKFPFSYVVSFAECMYKLAAFSFLLVMMKIVVKKT